MRKEEEININLKAILTKNKILIYGSRPIVEEFYVNLNDEMEDAEDEEDDVEEIPAPTNTNETIRDPVPPTGPFKRARQSEVWKELTEPILINQQWFVKCTHCLEKLKSS